MYKLPGIILGLALGVGAGMALGILFAPRKGEETRDMIKHRAMEARKKAMEQIAHKKEELHDKTKEVVSGAHDTLRGNGGEQTRPL